MAAGTSPIFVESSNCKGASFAAADTTTKKDLFVAGADGSLLRGLSFCSSDSATINMDLWLNDGSTDYAIGTIPIAAGSGITAASNAVNGLDTTKIKAILAPDGSLFLPTGWKLKGNCKATMTTGACYSVAVGGDY